mmetsp:Transcript_16004/g.37070  ORF Transcript_16004/g.37070 Transcript_16004/m.37070 type:complete len:597 (+) Transcript_16004:314-2104(+)|eukprot:CAMPEP_0197180596 /NCGR_PEP_ID=MMETSP1423-20130617/5154_1 /TAXON_ID=476441 /ORGANISM="Pseudo-nitzschia heimii, Strain UNC1101" /LENGTH=596 /DNA_ID=CAMNT_0042630697 /DNA_START=216 /DNA_END=2006 /DNA_ORIENTATION=-
MTMHSADPGSDSKYNASVNATTASSLFPNDEQSLDCPCLENEDLDFQSHHSFESMNKPIVVGYAFGPKKMSTMGVVLAEASRVKVIHEELKEDNYHEDEEHDDEGLFCEQEDLSLLTSAALRGLEEEVTGRNRGDGNDSKSTIITIGNSNDTDLEHIVRYFRSSCFSAAATASTTSVSETTVSTPTTTNSCSTYINYKQRRTGGGEKQRFPVQISFVPLDPDQPLEEQHGGKFDLILHKLTEDILTCSLMQDENHSNMTQLQGETERQRIKDPSLRRVQSLRDYCYSRNPNCCLVDDPEHVQTVMSRSEIANMLQRCLKGVKTSSGIPVKSPRFVVVPERNNARGLVKALQRNDDGNDSTLSLPLIVKPLIAAGTKQSHNMLIALHESALTKLPSKSIVQEFVNHNATLYKVYVLGDFVNVYKRHSLPNLPSDLSQITKDLVEFDSQRPYPKLKDFGLQTGKNSDCNLCRNPDFTLAVTEEEVRPVVEVLKRAFGLELFGFDVLMGSDRDECFVVDVNYFPSYKEVSNFPSLLARYLTQRVLEQRRKKRTSNFESNKDIYTSTITTSTTKKEGYGSTSDIDIDIAPHIIPQETSDR